MYSRDTPYIVKSSQECENMAFWVIEEKRGGSSMLGKSLYIIVYCDRSKHSLCAPFVWHCPYTMFFFYESTVIIKVYSIVYTSANVLAKDAFRLVLDELHILHIPI